MYYWRLWREKRVRFFALLILGACVGASAWPQARSSLAVHADPATMAALGPQVWHDGIAALIRAGGGALYFVGLLLGASGLGEELERGTAVFLLTRPRPRGYFVWSFWLISCVEVVAFALMTMVAGYVALFYLTRRAGPSNFLFFTPVLIVTGLLAVGLSNVFALASRSSKNAVAGGMAFAGMYFAIATGLHAYHIADVPTPLSLYDLDWTARFAGIVAGWFALSLALVGLSHFMASRLEV